jgi:hypothetical protein
MNSNASIICQSHHNQIYKVQHQKGSRSLASKCPQRISGLSAPERDVTIIENNIEAFHESLCHKNQHFKNWITNNYENLEVLLINIIGCNNVI